MTIYKRKQKCTNKKNCKQIKLTNRRYAMDRELDTLFNSSFWSSAADGASTSQVDERCSFAVTV